MANQGAKFATGKWSKSIDDRFGEKHDYREMVIEPDTKIFVHRDDVDEPDPYRRLRSRQDAIAVRNPRTDLAIADAVAVANGICQSQAGTAGVALTLNGSLVASGVATLDANNNAKQVIVTSAGNDLGVVFAISGTISPNGPSFTEQLTGANAGIAGSSNAFYTVTSVVPSGNTASTVTVGTAADGSIFDTVPV